MVTGSSGPWLPNACCIRRIVKSEIGRGNVSGGTPWWVGSWLLVHRDALEIYERENKHRTDLRVAG